jgi:TonB family protein
MKSLMAVALSFLFIVLMFAPSHAPAQESSEGSRKVVAKVRPLYPDLARSMKIQGIVKANVLVAPSGKVTAVEVKGGHPVLAQSAEDALRQWKWEPAAHETHETVELRFNP